MVARYLSVFIGDRCHFLGIHMSGDFDWRSSDQMGAVYGSPKSIEMTVQFWMKFVLMEFSTSMSIGGNLIEV